MTPLPFFLLMLRLEQSGIWIPDGWSIIFTFSLTTTFYLTKYEKELETLKYGFHTTALSKGTIFDKNANVLKKILASEN